MRKLKDRKRSRGTEAGKEEDSRQERLSDEELFLRAMEGLDEARIYDAKYRGGAGAELPERSEDVSFVERVSGDPEAEREARERVREVQEAALFERMVGGVEPIEGREKYYKQRPSQRVEAVREESRERKLLTPALATAGPGLHDVGELNEAQRGLLRRAEEAGSMELHLRGDKVGEALRRLEEAVAESRGCGRRFLTVICGRGIRSELFPVLKPAVIRWLEEAEGIRGYAPKRLSSGDYGAVVVELLL